MKYATIIAAGVALLASSVRAQDGEGGEQKVSLQEQLERITTQLREDEEAVKKLANKECTDLTPGSVGLTGKGNPKQCGALGVLTTCEQGSVSYGIVKDYSDDYVSACLCVKGEKKKQQELSKFVADNKAELSGYKSEMEEQTKKFEAIHQEFVSSNVLANMDKAIGVLSKMKTHVTDKGLKSASPTMLETAQTALSNVRHGEYLSEFLQTAVERVYTAENSGGSVENDSETPAQKLLKILDDLIEYLRKEKDDIQAQVDAEQAQKKALERKYASNKKRINALNQQANTDFDISKSKEGRCHGQGQSAMEAHAAAASKADKSHKSFQKYMTDVEQEKTALGNIMDLLAKNHGSVLSKAVQTANQNSGTVTHLYDLAKGLDGVKFTSRYILRQWFIGKKLVPQGRGCRMHTGAKYSAVDRLYRSPLAGAGLKSEWVPYLFQGKAKTGCGGCNGGVGLDLGSHWAGKCSPGYGSHVQGYAMTAIYNPSKKGVKVFLESGADDGFRVWVNGKLVQSFLRNCRCYDLNQRNQKRYIMLGPGINTIVIKVAENRGHWGYVGALNPRGATLFEVFSKDGNTVDILRSMGQED